MNFDPLTLFLATAALPVAAAALLIERLFGYPDGPQAWIGHPVQWMGALIAWLEKSLNNRSLNNGEARKIRGLLALFILMGVTLALTVPLTLFLREHASGWIGEAFLASTLLSQK